MPHDCSHAGPTKGEISTSFFGRADRLRRSGNYAHNTPRREEAIMRTIDIHTHVLADATIKLLQKELPQLALKLTATDAENSALEVAGVRYTPFPRGGHDIARRFADMDAAEVDMHVLSVAPQTWAYSQEAAVGAAI